jgi:Protein of unknown function (DUF3592)
MGFLRRAASKLNEIDVGTDLTLALTPSIRRVRRLEERGATANGVITGIRFSLDGDTTRKDFAITVPQGPDAGRYGIRTQPVQAHRLRLGMPVVLKVDRGRGVIDWSTMAAAWGLGDGPLAQESLRKPPDDGIVDTALDARVQRHLRTWTPTQATIVSLTRRSVMGMATLNWDIELQLADGRRSLSKSDEVPTYAHWYAAPGVVVPAVVDPDDPSKASIDWRALALAQFDQVGFDDDPPGGSIAAEVEEGLTAGRSVAGAGTPLPPPAPAHPGTPVTLDTTMQGWVEMVRAGHMRVRDFEDALSDWEAAGMCNPAQAAAARRAAGV